jgi:hypothetical protein
MAFDISLDALNMKTLSMFLAIAVLPLAIVAALLLFLGKGGGMRVPIAGLLALAVFLGGAFCWQLAAIRIAASPETLRVGGGLYRVELPMAQVQVSDIRRVRDDPAYRIGVRTNGIGMPGLALGWHRTASGEKVFAAVTDPERVVLIPTGAGYAILVSPPDPDAFIAGMKAL